VAVEPRRAGPFKALQSAVVRSSPVLGRLWRTVYAAIVWTLTTWMRWRADDDVSVYLVGSLGRGEPIYGLSDLDFVVVAAGDPTLPGRRRQLLARRLARIRKALPFFETMAPDVTVCEEPELHRAAAQSYLTHGLEDPSSPATMLGDSEWSGVALLQERPGVGRPLDTWRLVAGPDRRPASADVDDAERRIAAWLELQFLWRFAFNACVNPELLRTPYICLKIAAGALRTWLWLERDQAIAGRRDAFMQGLQALPEEEDAIRRLLSLEAALRRLPKPPLDDALGLLTRITGRVAVNLEAAAARGGVTEVRLVDGRGLSLSNGAVPPTAVPLADWRAVAAPRMPDEGLILHAGDPADPATITRVAEASRPGRVCALKRDSVVVLPTPDTYGEAMLRAVQCGVTDPVTDALLVGRTVAAFTELRGWSAGDLARRAVAEHAIWLRDGAKPPRPYVRMDAPRPVVSVARLLTAARAALFAISLERGAPTLALTVAGTASLAEDEQLVNAIGQAQVALHEWHQQRGICSESTVVRLRRAVLELDPYRQVVLSRSSGR
jgi:predicted nucleotidyltransferase